MGWGVGMKTIIGVLLAGGQSRRFGGGDKCLRPLAGRPLLDHAATRLKPQASKLVLNANGDARRFSKFGLAVVPDPVVGFAGPLAGVLAGLRWAQSKGNARWIVTAATDSPFFSTRSGHAFSSLRGEALSGHRACRVRGADSPDIWLVAHRARRRSRASA